VPQQHRDIDRADLFVAEFDAHLSDGVIDLTFDVEAGC
jgi:hypothetical protein